LQFVVLMSLSFNFLRINYDFWLLDVNFSGFLGLGLDWFLRWELASGGCLNDFALLHASLFGRFACRFCFDLNNWFFYHTCLLGLRLIWFRLLFGCFFWRSPALIRNRIFFLMLINEFFVFWNVFRRLRNFFFTRQFLSFRLLLGRLFWLWLVHWHRRAGFFLLFLYSFFLLLLLSLRNMLRHCFLTNLINPTNCQ
jgi:hypothetical protein